MARNSRFQRRLKKPDFRLWHAILRTIAVFLAPRTVFMSVKPVRWPKNGGCLVCPRRKATRTSVGTKFEFEKGRFFQLAALELRLTRWALGRPGLAVVFRAARSLCSFALMEPSRNRNSPPSNKVIELVAGAQSGHSSSARRTIRGKSVVYDTRSMSELRSKADGRVGEMGRGKKAAAEVASTHQWASAAILRSVRW